MKLSTLISISFSVLFLTNCELDRTEIYDQPQPEINHFYAREDTIGSVVTIVGKHFSEVPSDNVVTFNSAETHPFYSSRDTLKVIVPESAKTSTISLQVQRQQCESVDTFFVLTGKWTKMADCPGDGRFDAVGFSVGKNGYISTGTGYGKYLRDTWAFDPVQNRWQRAADFPEGSRREAFSFSIGNKAYVGYGTNTDNFSGMRDFYEFDPATNQWTRKADIPLFYNYNAVGLTLNDKGYIITGAYSKQVLEYDPVANRWTRKKDFPGEARSSSAGFVINGKGYIAGGNNGREGALVDFWEYEPMSDTWTRKADMKRVGYEAIGFSVKGKGYIGNANGAVRQLWEYDPATDEWAKKKYFPGTGLRSCVSFVIDDVAYVGTGVTYSNVSNELWKFEPE
jgi:N-acetylneuraminic acid mutarotase